MAVATQEKSRALSGVGSRKPVRLLVVGNGATAVDSSGSSYINKHSCQFIVDLARLGFQVSFLQPQESFDRHSNLYDCIIPAEDIRVLSLRRTGLFGKLSSICAGLVALLRADFVYLFYPGKLPRRLAGLCRLTGKPYGLYLRGEKFARNKTEGAIFRDARFIVSVSPALVEPVVAMNSNITIIKPMLDISAADAVRRQFDRIGERPLRLLFVGRLEEAKGVSELIEACRIMEERGIDFELSLVGGGPYYPEFVQRFGDRPISRIRIVGAIADKNRLMQFFEKADVLVLPTHHEGFPRVLYEAMIKSTTIITTMVGGIPGLMRDEENCLSISVRDPVAIADAVERLAGDRELLQNLSRKGLDTVLQTLASRPSHLEAVMSMLNE